MQESPRRNRFGVAVLTFATFGMAIVLWPFWTAVFWAIVLGILFWPLRQKMVRWMGGRTTVASILIVLLILVFVLLPIFFIAGLITDGVVTLVAQVQSGAFQPATIFDDLPARFPKIAGLLSSVGLDMLSLKDIAGKGLISAGHFALQNIIGIGQGASLIAFKVVLMLYLVFVALQNGDQIYRVAFEIVPLTERQKRIFFSAFAEMSVATIKGIVAVGAVQAVLGGLIFWIVGIDSAAFWGALMGLLSVVPPFGAGLIWAPAGVFLILNGDMAHGLILLAFGAGVISTSDNVVRPIVVGRASSVPDYLVLLTTLGGLAVFGLTGLVLGPVVASLFLSGWKLFDESAKESL